MIVSVTPRILKLGISASKRFFEEDRASLRGCFMQIFSDDISIRTYGPVMLRNLPLKQRPVQRQCEIAKKIV